MKSGELELGAFGKTFTAYYSLPESGWSAPPVIVLQEWWGLADHIREVCDRLAQSGFVALAPDLYDGFSTEDDVVARRTMLALNIEGVIPKVETALEFLFEKTGRSESGAGIVGFCMGGMLALFASCRLPAIRACVDFYGIHPKVHPELASLHCPVLGIFGGKDHAIPVETAEALRDEALRHGKEFELVVYPEAPHAFLNDSRPEFFDAESAEAAWAATLRFLGHLIC